MTHATSHADRTVREAVRIYRTIIRSDPPRAVVDRFARVCERLHDLATQEEVERYYDAIARCEDLEALELAARYRGRLVLLTQKVRMMVYLAETVPENQRFFVGARGGRVGAFGSIAAGAMRTAYKLIKGMVLLARVPDG